MPSSNLLARARDLRRSQTDSEGRLWGVLRNRRLGGWKWRRQTPVGPYFVDFYCPAARLVVELDGSQHLDRIAYDERRTRYLNAQGLRVVRFDSDGVWGGALDHICETILAACGGAPHRPEPGGSGHVSPTSRGEGYQSNEVVEGR